MPTTSDKPRARYGGTFDMVVNGWHVEKLPAASHYGWAVDSPDTGYGRKFHSCADAYDFAKAMDCRAIPPATCMYCEYDRRFPGFEAGGWLQQDNNGPIVSCPVCNNDGAQPRQGD